MVCEILCSDVLEALRDEDEDLVLSGSSTWCSDRTQQRSGDRGDEDEDLMTY